MVFAMDSPWLAGDDTDTQTGVKKLKMELKFRVNSRPSEKDKKKVMTLLTRSHLRVDSISFDGKEGTFTLVGHINTVEVLYALRKICIIDIVSLAILTPRNDTFPTTERITELILIEDTGLGRNKSLEIQIPEEQQQSDMQREDQPPPGQADSYVSQVEASPPFHPLPPLACPLASKAQPSSSAISHPFHGMPDQMQAAPDHASELWFPFAPSSSCIMQTESLTAIQAHSGICGGACLPKDTKLVEEEEGLGGHGQLFETAILHLLSGIGGINDLRRHYNLHAGEMASRLKDAEDTIIMLRRQVEELEARLSMANMPERRLMDMDCASEDEHARTKMELALMREKMDEANCRHIEYLEAEVSRYQNRIIEAKREKKKAEVRASGGSDEGGTMSTIHPSAPAPWSTSLNFFPSLLRVLVSQTWRCARKALFFLDVTSYLDNLE